MIVLINNLKSILTIESDEMKNLKPPVILAIILVYLATIFTQNEYEISSNAIKFFTIVIVIHLLLFLLSDVIFKRIYWLYFLIQGVVIFDCSIIIPRGFETVYLGLMPVLIFQSIMVYSDSRKALIASIFFYIIFCGTILIVDGFDGLLKYIPMLMLINIAVRAYSIIFLRQIKMRIKTQKVLQELEFAYEKVEELTLINERERMARDLHDTLSQGLAGIIMQLEAANANLNRDNTERAQEIVQMSMKHARKTLSDSRLVIDDLRLQENTKIDFTKAIENEINQFKSISKTSVSVDIKIRSEIPMKIFKNVLYIVREGLNNIAKHAKAKETIVEIIENQNKININIIDDGVGFDVKLLDRLFGHYGIIGMTERVKAIDGKIKIKSKKRFGTSLNIIIPIEKGIDKENG
ncbi:sensor histidine kinase [Clostridium sp. SHJSY1]|uniref:sensor histidine kinase n=1 Tax=Clostridium sp. SHJSY1 TaxID=2942483 RepID=UPI002875E408|nr:sensor histidine kinase [Clostridium sp. SHJSY1]MDS0526045.1 sensor histidine kinase [Clostridium sp. SHJSY1]